MDVYKAVLSPLSHSLFIHSGLLLPGKTLFNFLKGIVSLPFAYFETNNKIRHELIKAQLVYSDPQSVKRYIFI